MNFYGYEMDFYEGILNHPSKCTGFVFQFTTVPSPVTFARWQAYAKRMVGNEYRKFLQQNGVAPDKILRLCPKLAAKPYDVSEQLPLRWRGLLRWCPNRCRRQ